MGWLAGLVPCGFHVPFHRSVYGVSHHGPSACVEVSVDAADVGVATMAEVEAESIAVAAVGR